MSIFDKQKRGTQLNGTPLKNLKKFLDMRKTTTNKPVLQRSGQKISYMLIINELKKLG
jgi:hypothetical protein